MTLTANWSYPTAIRFGAGRISELPDCCKALGISKPLLVTDRDERSIPMSILILMNAIWQLAFRSTVKADMTA